jgi:hypothetical protein
MTEATPQPQPEPALVLDRWNSWVRLYFPSSGGTGWINLAEVDYELLDGAPLGAPVPCPRAEPPLGGIPEATS